MLPHPIIFLSASHERNVVTDILIRNDNAGQFGPHKACTMWVGPSYPIHFMCVANTCPRA